MQQGSALSLLITFLGILFFFPIVACEIFRVGNATLDLTQFENHSSSSVDRMYIFPISFPDTLTKIPRVALANQGFQTMTGSIRFWCQARNITASAFEIEVTIFSPSLFTRIDVSYLYTTIGKRIFH